MKKYKISWTDKVGFYSIVEAENEEQAQELFDTGQILSVEPDSYVETIYDSLNIEEVIEHEQD